MRFLLVLVALLCVAADGSGGGGCFGTSLNAPAPDMAIQPVLGCWQLADDLDACGAGSLCLVSVIHKWDAKADSSPNKYSLVAGVVGCELKQGCNPYQVDIDNNGIQTAVDTDCGIKGQVAATLCANFLYLCQASR